MFRMLVLFVGLLLVLGAGSVAVYQHVQAWAPVAAVQAEGRAATLRLARVAAAAATLADLAPLSPLRNLVPEPEAIPASPVLSFPALPVTLAGPSGAASEVAAHVAPAAPEPVDRPPAVRHGVMGLGGAGTFSCTLEFGVRRCRAD